MHNAFHGVGGAVRRIVVHDDDFDVPAQLEVGRIRGKKEAADGTVDVVALRGVLYEGQGMSVGVDLGVDLDVDLGVDLDVDLGVDLGVGYLP